MYIFGHNSSNILLARDWSKRITRPNMPQLKLGNIHLVRKYARIYRNADLGLERIKKIDSYHLNHFQKRTMNVALARMRTQHECFDHELCIFSVRKYCE